MLSAGCKIGKSTPTPSPTEAPTATPSSQSIADFQLVGRAVHAFVGVGPGIDTSGTTPTSESPAPTQATSTTFGNPTERGVMRVMLDDASDSLKTNCGAARDESAIVYWTTDTQFDTSLLGSDLESSLEGRSVGVVGRVFTASQTSDQVGAASPSPSSSPGSALSSDCVLVADQIGTSNGTIPTAQPVIRSRRTARPTVTPTASPTAKPTASPTAKPSPSASPAPTPTST